ncbi:hypothetical protein CEXT_585161 [Caerostris extrusa]|uniref:Uncharacterized protein n=1 Tax=Caerostris extrusa TaxID=172846 RepID=A0AAV4QNW0_CAEEX|nr:hypothetical protein CEXT_585161 [Caerostris extrusa]
MLRISFPKLGRGIPHAPCRPHKPISIWNSHLGPTPPSPVFQSTIGHKRMASCGFSFFSVSYCQPYITSCRFFSDAQEFAMLPLSSYFFGRCNGVTVFAMRDAVV